MHSSSCLTPQAHVRGLARPGGARAGGSRVAVAAASRQQQQRQQHQQHQQHHHHHLQQQQQQHHHHHQLQHLHLQQQQPLRRLCAARAGLGFGGGFGKGKGSSKDCPCGSGRLYSACCQVFHRSSSLHPPTPEALVRARYAAFVNKQPKFLKQTSHPDNPALRGSSVTLPDGTVKQCSWEEDMAVTLLSIEFTGLEVLGSAQDGASATVDVEARYKRRVDETGKRVAQPPEQRWRERCILVRDDDLQRWLVRDVVQLAAAGEEAGADAAAAGAAGPVAT